MYPDDGKRQKWLQYLRKGIKNKTNFYRPISLCILCKILENLITTQLQNYIEVMNTFTLTDLLDNHKDIYVLYLDCSKAFDTVPQKRLMQT